MKTAQLATAENVITLTVEPKPKRSAERIEERFKIQTYTNPRTGTPSFRVFGMRRDGSRVRENFKDQLKAQARQLALNTEFLAQHSDMALRATKLTDTQVKLAEVAFIRLGNDEDLLSAIDYWLKHGKELSVAESPRLDDAQKDFLKWVEATPSLRKRSKDKLKNRVKMFCNSMPNHRVADIGPAGIDSFFAKRQSVSALTRVGDKEAISRFFSWCMEHPRGWIKVNPCASIVIETPERGPAAILNVKECEKLIRKAESHRNGRLAPYIAVCLFGGLRPTEAQRLTWDKINLVDGEIRIEAQSSKRKEPRIVRMGDTLKAWLTSYKKKPFHPSNFRRDFDVIKKAAGYDGRKPTEKSKLKPWPADVLRHTAISHYFRHCKSYGETAEWAGNSESIIRKHYQRSEITSDDTKKFYALMPTKKGGRK